MSTKSFLAWFPALVLGVSACGHHSGHEPHGSDAVEAPGAEVVTVAGTHTVRCGCAIEEIRHCGNYVFVEGEPLELTGDIGLGKMEFCGQGDLQAKVEGTVVDGAVVATAYELEE